MTEKMNKDLKEALIVAIHEYYVSGEISLSVIGALIAHCNMEEDEASGFFEVHEDFIQWAAGEMEIFRDKLVEAYVKGKSS